MIATAYRILWISAKSDPPSGWETADGWEVDVEPPDQALQSLAIADYLVVILNLPLPGWPAAAL